jgi:hypothetical protein
MIQQCDKILKNGNERIVKALKLRLNYLPEDGR